MIGIVSAMLLCVVLSGCFLFGHVRSGDIAEYATLLEKSHDGNTPNTYGIFPADISGNANANEFYYEYYNPWDACFLMYLDLEYDAGGYEQELRRLQAIEGTRDLAYGATGFRYPVDAVCANDDGIAYALSVEAEHRVVYVLVQFHNYFTDIDYAKHVPEEYLPIGFDATQDNARRKAFDGE
jgi:hypothetical protein